MEEGEEEGGEKAEEWEEEKEEEGKGEWLTGRPARAKTTGEPHTPPSRDVPPRVRVCMCGSVATRVCVCVCPLYSCLAEACQTLSSSLAHSWYHSHWFSLLLAISTLAPMDPMDAMDAYGFLDAPLFPASCVWLLWIPWMPMGS